MPELFAETSRIAGIDFSQDVKTGVKRYVVRWFAATEDELESVGAESYRGIKLTSRQAANWEPDSNEFGYQVDLTYEYDPNEPEEDGESWSIKGSFTEKTIESHPWVKRLIQQFGGVVDADGKIQWAVDPPKDAEGNSVPPGLSQGFKASLARKNPLFGENSRLVFFAVATRKYYSKTLTSVYKNIGHVFETLPGKGPAFDPGEGKNWVKTAPSVDSHPELGWAVTEEYWLSDVGGHTQGIYKTPRDSGLTTGSLRTGSL